MARAVANPVSLAEEIQEPARGVTDARVLTDVRAPVAGVLPATAELGDVAVRLYAREIADTGGVSHDAVGIDAGVVSDATALPDFTAREIAGLFAAASPLAHGAQVAFARRDAVAALLRDDPAKVLPTGRVTNAGGLSHQAPVACAGMVAAAARLPDIEDVLPASPVAMASSLAHGALIACARAVPLAAVLTDIARVFHTAEIAEAPLPTAPAASQACIDADA